MRSFCVAQSPYELDEWMDATGLSPDHVMIFEAWSRRRSLKDVLARARSFGHDEILITWEPWEPIPVGATEEQQRAPQPEYSADAICAGDWDYYIDEMARSFRDSGMSAVYLRLAHEMNGDWYPWSGNPNDYIRMWKYIRYRMRSLRGAWNTKFVWAPNPDLWRTSPADWLRTALPYWPGPRAVEYFGSTMINFGADHNYPVSQFVERFHLARLVFEKPMLAAEVNVALELAEDWLTDLASAIGAGRLPITCASLSQGQSRAESAGTIDTGTLSWNLTDQPDLIPVVSQVIDALHGT